MLIFYPALITSAIFFAAIVVNLKNQNYGTVFGLGLLAIPSVLFLLYLSQINYDILAYILLAVPIIIVVAGYEMGIKKDLNIPASIPRARTTTTTTITTTTPPTNVVPPRIEPTEGAATSCRKCQVSPCMCPYKPPSV